MGKVDKENVFELIVNKEDQILARLEYAVFFLDEYEGEYIENCLQHLKESIYWYKQIKWE